MFETVDLRFVGWVLTRLCLPMAGCAWLMDTAYAHWHKFWILQLGVVALMFLFFGLVAWAERNLP